MKKLNFLLTLIFIASAYSIQAQDIASVVAKDKAEISWTSLSQDVGVIMQNKPAEVEYTFKNSGNAPLIIENVRTSCGCTAGKYGKEPIMPGQSSSISVSYNAKSPGKFQKTITVYTNAGDPSSLIIKGEVVAN
jgi:hypothetical protein